ncbi:MAG: hypothetical protein H6849_04795 [Alphaproteobacteria bacterium]|nr:MAG: hypothetical protein H6849_04795 [Alphaproteobacteria bacterium]
MSKKVNNPLFVKRRIILLICFCVAFVFVLRSVIIQSSQKRCVWGTSAEELASNKRYIQVAMDGDLHLVVDRNDQNLCREVNLAHSLLRAVQQTTGRLMKKGDHVVEVGAGYGVHTLRFSRIVGDKGHVIAFEVNAKTVKHLQNSLVRNNIYNVTVNAQRLSDSLVKPMQDCDGHASQCTDKQINDVREPVPIKQKRAKNFCSSEWTQTLDGFLSQAQVDFLWIDVVDYVPLIVKGAAQTLANNPNITIFLHWRPKNTPRHQQKIDELLAFFEYEKFNVWRVDPTHGLQRSTLETLFDTDAAYIVLSRKEKL